jgi:uncharacterized protein (TIGR03435 family)
MNRAWCILAFVAGLASAQNSRASRQSATTFDVVSVKPMPPDQRDQSESECADGGRFISRGTPLLWAIKWAYGLNDYQISPSSPDWLSAFGAYDIEAAAKGRVTEEQCRLMVQSMFEDRFKLSMHRETRMVSAYALVIGKNGPKLGAGGRVRINGSVKQAASEREPPDGWTMARLANYLASVRGIGRPVLDQTGLAGTYGLTLNYSTTDGDDGPDVFGAVTGQLGLRLRAIKAPIEMFIVDHVEKPSAN